MHINLVLIPFIIILGLLLSANDNDKNRRLYIVLCSMVLLFVAALRSPEWMTRTYRIDSFGYQIEFEEIADSGLDDIWSMIYARYWMQVGNNDVGFIVLQKLIGLFTHSYFIFSIIADLLFFIPFGVILYRYSTKIIQIVFAYVFYIALVQVFLLGGARQIFAIGFDMMALLAITDRKTLKAVIFFLIGISIHYSSFLFLIPLLMIKYETRPRVLKILHLTCFFVFPIVLLLSSRLIVFMGESIGMERYANYGEKETLGGALVFIILIEILSLFCFMAIKQKDLNQNGNMRQLYVMTPFLTLFGPLIYTDGTMIRVSLYYHLFLTLLVPYAIDCMFKRKDRTFLYFLAIGVLTFLTLSSGGIRYYFFWQV